MACAVVCQVSRSSGSTASSPSRNSPASAGAWPSVEIASVTPPLRTTPPRYAEALARSSTAFTNTCRDSAASATWRFTSGVAAATTNQASSRSAATNGRRGSTRRARRCRVPRWARRRGRPRPLAPAPPASTRRPARRRRRARGGRQPEEGGEQRFAITHTATSAACGVSRPRAASASRMRSRLFDHGLSVAADYHVRTQRGSYGLETPVKCASSPASALRYSPFTSRSASASISASANTSTNGTPSFAASARTSSRTSR